jgi:hypothetical protein
MPKHSTATTATVSLPTGVCNGTATRGDYLGCVESAPHPLGEYQILQVAVVSVMCRVGKNGVGGR